MTYDRELRTEAAHALTHNQEVWSDRGYAVVTAGGLSEGDTDFEVDVGPYDVLVGDTGETSVGPTTLSVNAPDSDPYWLVVYVGGEGLQTEQGPEGEVFVGDQSVDPASADVREITSPAPPTLAAIGPVTVLGKVLVTSSGVSNSLIDDRTFGGARIADSLAFRSLDTQIDTTNLSDEAVTAAKIAASAVESGKIASDAVGVDELAAALGTDSANPVPGTSHFESLAVDSATVTNGIDAGSVTTDKLNGEDPPERLFFDTYDGDAVDESITVDLPRSGETAVIIDFSLANGSISDPLDISVKLDDYDGNDYDYRLKDGLDDTVPVTGDSEFVLTSGRGNRANTGTFVIKNGENGRPTIYGDGSCFESDGVRSVLAFGCLRDGLTDPITSVDIEAKSEIDDWNGFLLVNEVERS